MSPKIEIGDILQFTLHNTQNNINELLYVQSITSRVVRGIAFTNKRTYLGIWSGKSVSDFIKSGRIIHHKRKK